METEKPKQKIRLNLDLSPKVKDQLQELQNRSDATSFVEVIRRSLALYNLVLDHEAEKGRVILENADGTRELLRILN